MRQSLAHGRVVLRIRAGFPAPGRRSACRPAGHVLASADKTARESGRREHATEASLSSERHPFYRNRPRLPSSLECGAGIGYPKSAIDRSKGESWRTCRVAVPRNFRTRSRMRVARHDIAAHAPRRASDMRPRRFTSASRLVVPQRFHPRTVPPAHPSGGLHGRHRGPMRPWACLAEQRPHDLRTAVTRIRQDRDEPSQRL